MKRGKIIALIVLMSAIAAAGIFALTRGNAYPGTSHDQEDRDKERDDEAARKARERGGHEKNIVSLTPGEMEEFGIKVDTAVSGILTETVRVTGEIEFNADRHAHIVPRYSGIVREVHKRLGDRVRKGEILAVIESNESMSTYAIRSLIDGTVIGKHITLGEMLGEDVPAFEIADLSDVWVDLRVYPKDLPLVREGQQVILSAGEDLPEKTGRISYLSPAVDEHTRTALARVVLPNNGNRWSPGTFVTGRIRVKSREVSLLLPKSALQIVEGRPSVFVRTDQGFIPVPVETGAENETHISIVTGMDPDQAFISQGAFTLKSQLEKDGFGGGHAH